VTLTRPLLTDTRGQIAVMPSDQVENLKNNEEVLLGMIMSDREIEPIRKELNKHLEEVKKLACKSYYSFNQT
jgi:hypothetical protein